MRIANIALAVLIASPIVARAESPNWQSDYTVAQKKAATMHKPLAIVFGKGADGWQQVGGGTVTADAAKTLANQYVCYYVDTATPAGKELAKKFEITGPVGLVISDRDAALQAFWHEGILSADVLAARLTRYSDPQRVVTTTDTNATSRVSGYPPAGDGGTFINSSCPSCGNTGFRRR